MTKIDTVTERGICGITTTTVIATRTTTDTESITTDTKSVITLNRRMDGGINTTPGNTAPATDRCRYHSRNEANGKRPASRVNCCRIDLMR